MKTWRTELHSHTVLSPCAEIEMIPPLIVQEALDRGIQLLAVTDHNASGNVAAVQRAAEGTGLVVLPGMELQTREEVHLLCLFDQLDALLAFQAQVDRLMPPFKNQPEHFGDQLLVDETGDFLRREDRLLLTSANLELEDAAAAVEQLGGLAIPAHVDRRANGLIALLGMVPTGVAWPALEVSRNLHPADAPRKLPQVASYPLLQGGDAHRLEELLGRNHLRMEAPTIAEITKALLGLDGRSFTVS